MVIRVEGFSEQSLPQGLLLVLCCRGGFKIAWVDSGYLTNVGIACCCCLGC